MRTPSITLPVEAYGHRDAEGKPLVDLEFIHKPLYSTVAIDGGAAMPRTVDFFSYTRGQTVTGAGGAAIVATPWHTNMEVANKIPAPRTFTVVGVRIIVLPLEYDTNPGLPGDTVGVGLEEDSEVGDIIEITQASFFELKQAQIREVIAPLFLLPSKVGIGGLAATSISNTNAASVFQTRVAPYTDGVGWNIKSRPFVLWDSQFFTARLRTEWGTNPTPIDEKILVCVLDGIEGREVQG